LADFLTSDESVEVDKYANDIDVKKNTVAEIQVVLVRKFPAPRPPNTCCAAAPVIAPSPPPFPGCNSTTRIMKRQTIV